MGWLIRNANSALQDTGKMTEILTKIGQTTEKIVIYHETCIKIF